MHPSQCVFADKAAIDLHLNCLCLESSRSVSEEEGSNKTAASRRLFPRPLSPLFVYHWVLRFTIVFQALEGDLF